VGLSVGSGLGPALLQLGIDIQTIQDIGCLCVVLLFVLSSALAPHSISLWDDLLDFMNGIERIPLHAQALPPRQTGLYREKCLAVARSHRLTARESEVFLLLAKGRNASVIARELIVSEHTAKTHIYHIFSKLTINTQQELIDYVEAYEFKREEIP
jgi:DNA-binding CsgD family transcriptional regulator